MFATFGLSSKFYSLDQSLPFSNHFSSRSSEAFSIKVWDNYALLLIYLKARGHSFENCIIKLEINYTDASAASKMLDLLLLNNFTYIVPIKGEKVNHSFAIFSAKLLGFVKSECNLQIENDELSQSAINISNKCGKIFDLLPIEFHLSH